MGLSIIFFFISQRKTISKGPATDNGVKADLNVQIFFKSKKYKAEEKKVHLLT